jgi:hypothetical protein
VTLVYIAVATCKPPNAGPIHCDLLICGPDTIPVCYICSVTYRDGAWPGGYKINMVMWHSDIYMWKKQCVRTSLGTKQYIDGF